MNQHQCQPDNNKSKNTFLQVVVLAVAWLASSLAYQGLRPEATRLLTGARFLDLALQGFESFRSSRILKKLLSQVVLQLPRLY